MIRELMKERNLCPGCGVVWWGIPWPGDPSPSMCSACHPATRKEAPRPPGGEPVGPGLELHTGGLSDESEA